MTQAQQDPQVRPGGARLKRVLFLCLGNACRSQMAEAFARAYGSDVMEPSSAGLSPAVSLASDTVRAMDEKNINIRRQFPKSWMHLPNLDFDLVVNLSGYEMPAELAAPAARVWKVPDPIATDYATHCKIRDQLENLVMALVLEFRRAGKSHRA